MLSGVLYFLLVFSFLPVCHISHFFDTEGYLKISLTYHGVIPSVWGFGADFCALGWSLFARILTHSYISAGVLVAVAACTCLFPGDDCTPGKRIMLGLLHCAFHLAAAITCAVMVELMVEMATRRGHLAQETSSEASYNRWASLREHDFPAISSLQAKLDNLTGGLASQCQSSLMSILDLPDAMAYSRREICREVLQGSSVMGVGWLHVGVSRGRALVYYVSFFLYFWLLATVSAAHILGSYLYFGLNWFGLHWNEAFSSLQIKGYKNILRFRIVPGTGDLEVYSLGIDRVPKTWVEDEAWNPYLPTGSHEWEQPSRWRSTDPCPVRVVDHFQLCKAGKPGSVVEQGGTGTMPVFDAANLAATSVGVDQVQGKTGSGDSKLN